MTITQTKWWEVDLSQFSDEYPFFKFFSGGLEGFHKEVEIINKWIDKRDTGLLLTGNDTRNRSKVLYLVAHHLYLPIYFAPSILDQCIQAVDNYRDDGHFEIIERIINSGGVIDHIGDEPVHKLQPLNRIIERNWIKGKGIIGGTGSGPNVLKAKYGDGCYDALIQSCTRVEIMRP